MLSRFHASCSEVRCLPAPLSRLLERVPLCDDHSYGATFALLTAVR